MSVISVSRRRFVAMASCAAAGIGLSLPSRNTEQGNYIHERLLTAELLIRMSTAAPRTE